jgi:alginate O-acetyltransferase complex protein AlgI
LILQRPTPQRSESSSVWPGFTDQESFRARLLILECRSAMLFRWIAYGLVLVFSVAFFAKVRSPKVRQAVLLIGSYALYVTWGVWFAAVLFTSTVMNFALGKWLRRRPSWSVLWTSIVLNLALLSVFKYLPAIAASLPFSSLQKFSHLALPLGISFWTFQALSYLFDVYRGEELDPSFVELALYMVFFPVAISGPICRMPEMLPQFRSEESPRRADISRGLGRIATGVLMMQLAQLLGQGILNSGGINNGYDHVTNWTGPDVWCLAFGYGLQLFFDFAGYTHIAVGAAKLLGITLPENFDRPFQSASPSIFWTRWHMSLSFWIRDYIFLPLAVLRSEMWWRKLVLVISMVVFGLWHKATVLFVLWGCYHGVLLALHRQVQQLERKFDWEPPAIWGALSHLTTIALISLGWVFFRANSLHQAVRMLSATLSPKSYFSHFVSVNLYALVVSLAMGYAVVLLISAALDRSSVRPESSKTSTQAEIIALIARTRWFWIPPIYAIGLLLVLTITLTHGADQGQFMYRIF